MSQIPTKPKYSPLSDRERVEYEELNKSNRDISTTLWTVSSVFLSINALAVGSVFEIAKNEPLLSVCVSVLFIIQWLLTTIFVVRMIEISKKVTKRLMSLDPHWTRFVYSTSELNSVKIATDKSPILRRVGKPYEQLTDKSLISTALQTPWGKLIIPLSTFLIFGWCILLIYFFWLSLCAA